MSIPGFTAHESLYDSPRRYRSSAAAAGRAHHAVSPATLILPAACNQRCRAGCLLSCREGCRGFGGMKLGQCLRNCLGECNTDCGC